MMTKNQEIIDRFFYCYIKRNFTGLREVVAEDISWSFLGQHKLAGVRKGINQVVKFFDTMTAIVKESKLTAQKLVIGSNENYIIECQHLKTNREAGTNIDHYVCVLWTFENGKIISGRHFFSDPKASDTFFETVFISENG